MSFLSNFWVFCGSKALNSSSLDSNTWGIYFDQILLKRLKTDIDFLFLGTDPCLGALCKSYGFCLYDDRAASCTCYDPWSGPTCVGSHHSKW